MCVLREVEAGKRKVDLERGAVGETLGYKCHSPHSLLNFYTLPHTFPPPPHKRKNILSPPVCVRDPAVHAKRTESRV